jgi:hypothetical protein
MLSFSATSGGLRVLRVKVLLNLVTDQCGHDRGFPVIRARMIRVCSKYVTIARPGRMNSISVRDKNYQGIMVRLILGSSPGKMVRERFQQHAKPDLSRVTTIQAMARRRQDPNRPQAYRGSEINSRFVVPSRSHDT